MVTIKHLYTDSPSQRNTLEKWERTALESFESKMTNKEKPFPCIPATIGYSLNQLRYVFIGDPRDATSTLKLSEALNEFTQFSREYGKYTSLIVFYKTPQDIKGEYSVEQYEQLFWKHLSELSAIDGENWPEQIPTDPHNPIWEYCYCGEPYFVYCATPAHKNRQSRHFDHMMLAITPRWVLQEFNRNRSLAARIKKKVRERLTKYDSISIHPDLNTYGEEGNYEWRQYFLRDDDTSLSKCPYHRMLKLIKIDDRKKAQE